MYKAKFGYQFDTMEKVNEFNNGAYVCFSGCRDKSEPCDEYCKKCCLIEECIKCNNELDSEIDEVIPTYYYVFVLGYDLLHDLLDGTPCDIAFDFCEELYADFEKSEYNSLNLSEYDCLARYIEDNYEAIKRRFASCYY